MSKTERPASPKTNPKKYKKRPTSWWWRILRVVLLVYLVIIIVLVYFEETLVYPGASVDVANLSQPTDGIAKTVLYGSEDPEKPALRRGGLIGREILRPGSRRWLIFFHGNAERAYQLDRWLENLSSTFEANVFAAEYRGFCDDRQPTEKGLIADAIAAVDFVVDTHQADLNETIYYGRSLGGGVATAVAVRKTPRLIVLDRSFDSAVSLASQKYWWVPVKWLMKNRFDSVARLTSIESPTLMIVAQNDEVMTAKSSDQLEDALTMPHAKRIDVPNLTHNDPLPAKTLQEAADWANQVMDSPLKQED